jgi:membrane-bound lytic murein transglycosylase F
MDANFFKDEGIKPEDRQKFIIASYNAGYGHVRDARALAVKYGYNPNIWDGNVEKMILAKSNPKYFNDEVCQFGYCRGEETVRYVSIIMTYYNHYLKYVKPK